MKATSSGIVFRWLTFRNQTGAPYHKYTKTRGTKAGKYGYRQVWLNGRHEYVHRVVCSGFHGTQPSPIHEVNHKNGNTADNRPSNLEWVTPKENSEHRVSALGKKTPKSIDYTRVRELLQSGMLGKDVAQLLGISKGSVSLIKNGKHK